MSTREFVVVLAPGRFDATLAQARVAWAGYHAAADVVLATEYGSGKFDPALIADGWDHFRGNGECVVAWDTDLFAPAWKGAGHADRIGSPFFRGGNLHAQTPLTSMPLRHLPTGRLVMFRVPHTPAHVQAGDGFRRTTPRVIGQAAAWVSSLAAMGRLSRRFTVHHKNAAQVIAGDWNVDTHRAHWRGVISTALGLSCAKPLPTGGDLGNRLVSWFFHRGLTVESSRVLTKRAGFDHNPVRVRFSIKETP